MRFSNTFATILTFTLTAGINISAFAAPSNVETIKNDRENQIENIENNNKSDKDSKSSQEGSQGSKCSPWRC